MKNQLHLLLTGDCWHAEFFPLFSRKDFRITFRPMQDVLENVQDDDHYDVVAIACSRRNQFPTRSFEELLNRFVNVPVVALSGSWCEGELRSGHPVAGVVRVYWHQWRGELDLFLRQMETMGLGSWHMPKISTTADRILFESNWAIESENLEGEHALAIGVSALTEDRFLMFQDAFLMYYDSVVWLESSDRISDQTLNASAVCLDGNSFTELLRTRIVDCQKRFPAVPIVLVLNFPRRHDFQAAAQLGINEIVSKPFRTSDLLLAIERTTSLAVA